MLLEAKEAGYYNKEMFGTNFDKIQILTVEKLLDGEQINMPNIIMTMFKTAEKKEETIEHSELF